jgi:excinuclease ABC subunit C
LGVVRPGLLQVVRELPWVYRFRDDEGAVLYVGRAAQLRHRVTSYFSDLRDRRHLKPMVAAVADIEVVVCGSRHEAAWLERNVLEAGLPPWNRTAGGQETPVVITVDRRMPSPGVRLRHLPHESQEGVRIFGPYLGGLQVRRAVAGLHRIYPLAYAGTRLTGAERSMADEHGVTERDRNLLAEKLSAVLERDSDAVSRSRAELEDRRRRAVAVEAFELAGRIHSELRGLEWITSLQRVTTLNGEDADVSGWSDGVLVTFAVRSGRLGEWTSSHCDCATAAPHLAATPASWTEFARRNADLAAVLDRSPLRRRSGH